MSNHVVIFSQPWEAMRLGLGAFLTSPGAGILGLVGAGYLTYRGVDKRIEADRKLARDARAEERRKERSSRRAEQERELNAYARERWQSSYDFLWTNRGDLPGPALLAGLEALTVLATTNQQVQMLKVLTMGINTEAQEQIG